ncbi:FAD-dependent oxidoreductase [Arthrobacter sp. ATA002]|uniref:FAD-dependent oxidoreductase n=1 Tax=Arthrobacter sp. ATA002 TaxID=2991715 RepID=UPI0022A790A2|nr:FAD-dependent oxidoreductase [Arthrobacter sp. ATA002]WAP51353.1 FAD-dependent oxidoreductase [Arthrobacter sp. ATA002]
MPESQQPEHFDAVVIGAGIMGATLASLLSRLEPQWRIAVLERLPEAGLESSHAWNNAGTGHAGLCEFNYTPRGADGSVDVSSALTINAQFQQSCEYWAHLARDGRLGNPGGVIRPIPHHSFGQGSFGVGYLRARHQAMSAHPPFAAMEYTEDPELIAQWLPLMFDGRPADEQVAATRVVNGTDVDYGALARRLLADAAGNGVEIRLSEEVTGVSRGNPGWTITSRSPAGIRKTTSPYVFLGAGGATLRLLQLAGIPETRSFGGFPISGCFYRTSKPELLQRHRAKVYGHAAEGVPPISVPHLDSRFVDGQEYLMFGPYGAFSPRFLKSGSLWDLARSIRPANLPTLLSAARDNFPMVAYLVRQILQGPGTGSPSCAGLCRTPIRRTGNGSPRASACRSSKQLRAREPLPALAPRS